MHNSSEMSAPRRFTRGNFFKLGGALSLGSLAYYLGVRQAAARGPQTRYPAYVDDGPSLPVFRGPYLQQEAYLAAGLFPAELEPLTALCEQYLNAPGDGQMRYVPLLNNVCVIFADMFVSSLDARDQQAGRLAETEVSFWILTLAQRKVGTLYVPDHLAWFLPYLFLDNGAAIATGREVYGFNKQAARFKKPARPDRPEFSAEVQGFKTFSPTAEAQWEPLLELQCLEPLDAAAAPARWPNWQNASADINRALLLQLGGAPDSQFLESITRLINDNTPLVFLKQVRDAGNTQQACYQAVIEAPLKLQQFYQGGILSGAYVLSVNALDSHPLARRLGLQLKNGQQRALLMAWMKVDFNLGAGVEIWRAT